MQHSALAIGLTILGLLTLGGCSKQGGSPTAAIGDTTAPARATATMPKPGLWEMTVSADGMPNTMKTKMCVGAPAPGTNPFAPPPQAGQDCTKNAFTKTATGYTIDVECKANGMTMSTQGEVIGDFSSAYKTVMHTKMGGPNIPAAMQTTRTSTAEAKYLGACPVDMKPGTAQTAS